MTAWHDALAGALQQLPGTVHKELQSTEEGNVDGTASGATTDGGRATEALAAGTALGDGIEESLGVIVTDSGGGGTSGGGWLGHRRSPSRHSAASSAKDERKKVEPAAAVYVNMEASRLAGWDDICVRSAVPQLLELAQAASNAKVIEQTARILSVLAGHGAPRWHKLVATLDVIATGILLVKSPDAMTRLHAVTLLAHLSDSEVHPTGGRMAQSMINLGAGPALAAVLPTLKPIQWWPQVVYCVSRAALHSARSSPQAPQALLANGIVRNLVEALGVLSEDAGATMAIHLAALRLFHLFAASPEMRLEVTRQGGLSYLMSLHRGGHDEASSGGGGGGPLEEAESPGTKQEQAPAPRGKVAESADCREVVRRQAEAALEALYAQDDSVVTYLPVQAVLQLTRCGMVKVKAQGAKGLEAAAEGGHLLDAQSTAAEARDVVESAAALLSESLEALQIRAVDTGPSSPSSSQANGVPAIMYSVMANTVKAVAKLAKVKGIHQTYIARLASRGLLLVAGASEVAVGLRAEAAAVVVMVTQGVEDWEALVQCGTATMVLLGALNAGDMAGSSAVFSESLAAILAGVCSTDGGRQQVDLLDGVAAVASLVQEHRANAPKQTQAASHSSLACYLCREYHNAPALFHGPQAAHNAAPMHGGSSQREWKPPPYGQSGPGGAWVQVLLLRALNFLLADAGIRSARLPPIKAKLFKFLFKRCLAAGSPLEVQREALRCLASLADASEDTFVWDELSSNKDSLKALAPFLEMHSSSTSLMELAVRVGQACGAEAGADPAEMRAELKAFRQRVADAGKVLDGLRQQRAQESQQSSTSSSSEPASKSGSALEEVHARCMVALLPVRKLRLLLLSAVAAMCGGLGWSLAWAVLALVLLWQWQGDRGAHCWLGGVTGAAVYLSVGGGYMNTAAALLVAGAGAAHDAACQQRTAQLLSLHQSMVQPSDGSKESNDAPVSSAGAASSCGFGKGEESLDTKPGPAAMSTVSQLEKVEWLNAVLSAVWPSLNVATSEAIRGAVQPLLDSNLPSYLTSIRFQQIDLGPVPPQFTAVRAVHPLPPSDKAGKEVSLDIDLQYMGRPDVVLHVYKGSMRLPVKLKELLISGCLRLTFQPLVPMWPLFSSIGYAFTKKPLISFSLKALNMEMMNLPLLNTFLEDLVTRLIREHFTLPKMVIAPDWTEEHQEFMAALAATKVEPVENMP
ncbi:hypothetical protein CYMTET_14785 [Cymbomonas tetramitiformis]|uniref:SMP-LTD domain-containing protein n=1 Tax=Cymbomonas tetramitiformis TaxID=36881 RepID=A0AAE0GFC7_9CHLO|nr:hypothetical protein CYMTET_14785 [Cymbomonas tetramitiformis]